MVASAGLGVAVVLLGAMGAGAWWTLNGQQETLESSREEQFKTVGTMLAKGVEGMLASGDSEGVRRVLSSASKTYGLEECVVRLSTGKVVADGTFGTQSALELPQRWSESQAPAETGEQKIEKTPGGGLRITETFWVPKRGGATIVLSDSDPVSATFVSQWRTQAGLGAIGAVALGGLLVVYRSMRARLRALGAINEALVAVDLGEQSLEALRVSADLGPAAASWNKLLSEREKLREKAMGERVNDELGNRRGRDSEVASACDALWQGVLLVDDESKIRFANGAAGVFLQGKREEMVGQSISRFLLDAKAVGAIQDVATGKTKQRTVVEIERNAEQGGGTLRFSIRPLRKEDHGRALVVVEDVTQQRVADAARNSFVAQATHELRTPLTNMRLYIDSLIEDGAEDPVKRTQAINVISGETQRLERIVGDMLSVAEIEAGSLRVQEGDVRLETLFGEIEAEFREQARAKEITFKMELAPKLPVIRGDRDKIGLAVHNLVGNAIKYTPAGGEVKVTVGETGGELTVEVKDNGIGIKPEEQDRVFDKFYRAKDKRIANITGTGLGLALAREVARLHGGDITVESQIDRGSAFTLRLPASAPKAAAMAA